MSGPFWFWGKTPLGTVCLLFPSTIAWLPWVIILLWHCVAPLVVLAEMSASKPGMQSLVSSAENSTLTLLSWHISNSAFCSKSIFSHCHCSDLFWHVVFYLNPLSYTFLSCSPHIPSFSLWCCGQHCLLSSWSLMWHWQSPQTGAVICSILQIYDQY